MSRAASFISCRRSVVRAIAFSTTSTPRTNIPSFLSTAAAAAAASASATTRSASTKTGGRTDSQKSKENNMSRSFPALFYRGGTSNGLIIKRSALPPSEAQWRHVLPAAMGSPDPLHGRQLDGMGGGASSLSKVCVLGPSAREGVDVDFTFVQVGVRNGELDLAGNCGNMLSAVGPAAFDDDEGIVGDVEACVLRGRREDHEEGEEEEAVVRIWNTNTRKLVLSRFRVARDEQTGRPRYDHRGDYSMGGVPGTQSRITLSFASPGGAKTGRTLPTGNAVDSLALGEAGVAVEASLVDASNPGVFVRGVDVLAGRDDGLLRPDDVEADEQLKGRLEEIRRAGAAAMGLDPDVESVPKVVMVFPPSSEKEGGDEGVNLRCLAMSMGQAHKAAPLTLALCLGVAARIPGTIPAQLVRWSEKEGSEAEREGDNSSSSSIVIGHPSGELEIGAVFGDGGEVVSAELHRTARLLMKGDVYY